MSGEQSAEQNSERKPSTKNPAFQFYPKDWQTDEDVILMSAAARGCYIDLLCHQWINGGSIPEDRVSLARVCRVSLREFNALWPQLAGCFPATKDGRLSNPRLERQRADQAEFHADKRQAGIRSAEVRRERFGTAQPNRPRTAPEQADRGAVATPSEPPSPSPSPSVRTLDHSIGEPAVGFEDFWRLYPRKVAKQAALRAWRKLKPNSELIRAIVADVGRRRRSDDWQKDRGQWIPHPATYLNGCRWEDESAVELPIEAPINGCFHHPPCFSMTEHTERLAAEEAA